MIESTFSERGWVWTGKVVEKSITCLTTTYLVDARMVDTAVRESEGEL